MNWQKLAPWNWFQDEEKESGQGQVPINTTSQLKAPSSMLDLHKEFDRLFFDLWRNAGIPTRLGAHNQALTNHWLKPSVDIKESEEAFEFALDIPGIEPKDIALNLEGNSLIISGERKHEFNEEKENYHQIERSYGSFRRVLSLPAIADKESIKASFKNGELSVKVNKLTMPQRDSRSIDIDIDG